MKPASTRRLYFALLRWLSVVVCLLVSRGALAGPELRAELSQEIVGRGSPVRLTLMASSDGGAVEQAEPGVAASVRAEKIAERPTHSLRIINGAKSERRTLTVEWTLTPQKLGTTMIRPSAMVGGLRVSARPLTLRVVAPGKAPPPPPPRSQTLDPFGDPFKDFKDPFKGLMDDFDADDFMRGGRPMFRSDPSLAFVTTPRGKLAFLHARVDKPKAVVGEQLTYSVYLFVDAEQQEPRYDDVHEAGTKDFLRIPVLPEEQAPKALGHTTLEGHLYTVKLLRRHALFPLRSGRLTIQPMHLRVANGRSAPSPRESERLTIDVTEPAATGRPPGYALGDVGRMRLSATVTPRETEVGGVVTVEVTLEGTGNLPGALVPPPRKAVEWLPPEQRAAVAPNAEGVVGGSRTFTWVVRAREPGQVDLGEISLPFFDAEAGKYETARAALGALTIRGAASKDDAPRALLEGLPKPLTSSAPASAGQAGSRRGLFYSLWLGPPALGLVVAGALRARRRLTAHREATKDDPKTRERAARAEVDRALKDGDARAADAAMRRQVELALELRTGTRLAGVDLDRFESTLAAGGVDAQAAKTIVALLREAEVARFSPGGASAEATAERIRALRSLVEGLPRARTSGGPGPVVVSVLLLALVTPASARAEGFDAAAKALEQGKPEIAISELEKLADRGVVDANASFNRGLAYAERVRLGGAQPGDLGRAIHGFEEARRLTTDAAVRASARDAIQVVRAEIARQRARAEAVELESRSFGETLVGLFEERTWATLAILLSLMATGAGAATARRGGHSDSVSRRFRIAGVVLVSAFVPLSVVAAACARERFEAASRTWAVVLSGESTALTRGRQGGPIPEGAIVEVLGTDGGRTAIRFGGDRTTMPRPNLRFLATR